MALVSYVLGDCPECGGKNTFGNIDVYRRFVSRGCGQCQYKSGETLPAIRKKILYLDQFFLSGAFRGGNEQFVHAAKVIERLTANQLMVAPYSSIHEDETHQWEKRAELFDFIKASSRGHQFVPHYDVVKIQLVKAFKRFFQEENPSYIREERDVLRGNVHDWDGYFRIDVGGYHGDIELLRELKGKAVDGLVDLFEGWRRSTVSYEDNVRAEHEVIARTYFDLFATYVERLQRGDFDALFDSPIAATFMQTLLSCVPDKIPLERRMSAVGDFMLSEYFRTTPYHDVSARMFATLKEMVKAGAYMNREKAIGRLSGYFFDVRHIATYAPYCDAIVVDKPMADLLSKPSAPVEDTYGCRIFSLQTWDEFLEWLGAIEEGMTEEHKQGLATAYPA